MPMDDLYTALRMFQSGVKDLQTSRAIQSANEEVQAIKSSELDQFKQRAALTDLSQRLVGHLSAMGTPAANIEAAVGGIKPAVYSNANSMHAAAVQSGDQGLLERSGVQQDFENNKAFELQKMKSQAALLAQQARNSDPFRQYKEEEMLNAQADKKLTEYGKALDTSKATSRSALGTWASTEARGERLRAVLGTPDKWKNMTESELGLVEEGLIQMSKGGVGTKDELEAIRVKGLEVQKARAKALFTNTPQPVDFSGYAGLFNTVIQREGDIAKEKMLDSVVNTINGNAHLGAHPRMSNQYKLTTASALAQLGIATDPHTIEVGKNGVVIPELQPILDAAARAPKDIRAALADAKKGNPEAMRLLSAYGLSVDTPLSEAIKSVRSKIKAKAFE